MKEIWQEVQDNWDDMDRLALGILVAIILGYAVAFSPPAKTGCDHPNINKKIACVGD